jgi:hypothetical protein
MAAKIRKLAMYAQQLAETGIRAEGRTGERYECYQDGHEFLAAKTRNFPNSYPKTVG